MPSTQFPRPTIRTLTRRKALASETRRRLADYREKVTTEPNPSAAMDLLWAIARLEQVLALETGGRFGDPYASPASVLERTSREARRMRGQEVIR